MDNIISQTEKNRIDALCKKYHIKNYIINGDGTIDVDGTVTLISENLISLPLKFGKVSGHFYIHSNILTSLEGCPISVGGVFNCAHNELSSLVGCPKVVNSFFCHGNRLSSLEGCPVEVADSFDCDHNQLTSLEHCPNKVGEDFVCSDNLLPSLEFCPKEVGRDFDCGDNELTSLEHSPNKVGGDFVCSDNKLTSLEFCPTVTCEIRLAKNPLPHLFKLQYSVLSQEEKLIFLLYQNDYEVWTPEFSEENMQLLIDDIKDGLQ